MLPLLIILSVQMDCDQITLTLNINMTQSPCGVHVKVNISEGISCSHCFYLGTGGDCVIELYSNGAAGRDTGFIRHALRKWT